MRSTRARSPWSGRIPAWIASTAPARRPPSRRKWTSNRRPARSRPASTTKENFMAHTLPNLPYAHDALEPTIDKQTMEIHHGKHHNAYVTNLNKALEGAAADLVAMSAEDLCKNIAK